MAKKVTTITLLILSIILISLFVVSTTYSVIIDVIDKDGESEIINDITIRDLVTNEDGTYNNLYYDSLNELNITKEDANIIMESISLNEALDVLLNSVVDYSIHNKNKLTNDEIYNIISNAIYDDNNIYESLKNKLINKTKEYINDISKYLYDIQTVNHGENA